MPLDPSTAARLARGLDGRDAARCRAMLEAHADQIRAAVEPALHDPPRGAAWLTALEALAMQGQHDRYVELVEKAQFDGHPVLAAWIVLRRGRLAFLKGLYRQALADAHAAEARLQAAAPFPTPAPVDRLDTWPPSPWEIQAEARLLRAAVARNGGDPATALQIAGDVAAAAEQRADRPSALRARFQEACALQLLGSRADAEAAYRALFGELAALGAERQRGLILANLGLGARQRGEDAVADAWQAEARALFERLGDRLMATKIGALDGAPDPADIRAVGDEESRLVAEMARGEALAAAGDRARAAVVLDQVRWTAEGLGLGWVATSAADHRRRLGADPPLVIDDAGFTTAAGVRVDLRRYGAPRRILLRLAEAHTAAEGPLAADALVTAGWPGERMRPESGLARVYTAVRSLRRLGLSGVLLTEDGGYRLDGPVQRRG